VDLVVDPQVGVGLPAAGDILLDIILNIYIMFMLLIATITSAMLTLISYGAFTIVFSFTIWMAVDAAKQDRFWWVVMIFGVPFVGSAVYYFTEKKHEYAKAESHHIHESETESQHEVSHPHHEHHRKDDVAPTILAENTIEENKKEKDTKKEEKEEKGETA
jgi:Ca2+/Na+ antiporter